MLAVGVTAACVHLYRNHDKQIDNAYKLDYTNDDIFEAEESPDSSPTFQSSYQQIHQQLPHLPALDVAEHAPSLPRVGVVARDNNGDVVELYPNNDNQLIERFAMR